jgi:hypothetical protein
MMMMMMKMIIVIIITVIIIINGKVSLCNLFQSSKNRHEAPCGLVNAESNKLGDRMCHCIQF